MSTKSEVLEILIKKDSEFVSGQFLASELRISRNSVWKAIESLKNDGYNILAVRNKGYFLKAKNDIISKAGIESYISDKQYFNIEVYDEIDSTNTRCKKYANEGAKEGRVVVSKLQTAGRGRFQRSFYSPSDTGVYFSFILRPEINADKTNLITTIAAIAVCRAIKKSFNIDAKIKWVNDIFINNRKVCGILTEANFSLENSLIESVVVGIGLNIYMPKDDFPKEIEKTAGYILENQITDARNKLVANILNEFLEIFTEYDKDKISKEYKNYSFIINKDVYLIKQNEKIKVRVIDINNENQLIVKYENGEIQALNSGEISIKLD